MTQSDTRYGQNPRCGYCHDDIKQGQPATFTIMQDGANRPLHEQCHDEYKNPTDYTALTKRIAELSEKIGVGNAPTHSAFTLGFSTLFAGLHPLSGLLYQQNIVQKKNIISEDDDERATNTGCALSALDLATLAAPIIAYVITDGNKTAAGAVITMLTFIKAYVHYNQVKHLESTVENTTAKLTAERTQLEEKLNRYLTSIAPAQTAGPETQERTTLEHKLEQHLAAQPTIGTQTEMTDAADVPQRKNDARVKEH